MSLQRLVLPAVKMLVIAVLIFNYQISRGQQSGVRNQAESLLLQWNDAHNAHDAQVLGAVYDSIVVIDGRQYTRATAITFKQNFFRTHSDYRQRIISDLRYKIYPANLIRCDFKKEMKKGGALWKYPAYVLITNRNGTYLIVGESDDASDRTLNLYLKLIEDKNISAPVAKKPEDTAMAIAAKDSTVAMQSEDSVTAITATVDSLPDVESPSEAVSEASDPTLGFAEEESVTIPVQYIYVFIGILVIGSLLLLLTGSRFRKRSARSSQGKSVEHDHYNREDSDVFEKFVMTLFDPLYFRAFRSRQQKVLVNSSGEADAYPELEFEFNSKEESARFIVESIYIKELKHRDIEIATPQQIRAFRQLDEDDNDLYLVVGIEGRPDDPKEIYLVPVRSITSPFITHPELQAYRKYGMFFYNAENKKLQ